MDTLCRNCLFDSLNKEDFIRNVQDYVKSLSSETKADERLYQTRLEICLACPNCLEGLCRICGCFVMARAAKKQTYCPAVERRW